MGLVTFNMSMSLDGFVAGPNANPENGLGDGGARLFDWYMNGNVEIPNPGGPTLKVSSASAPIVKEGFASAGAMITGRQTFDIAHGWGGNPPIAPCFVVTHSVPKEWSKPGSMLVFVTDGIESAIRQAKQVAGDKKVVVSTASTFQQALQAGLVDELDLDLVPILLGAGVRLFDNLGGTVIKLEIARVVEAPGVTHLRYRIIK